MNKYEYSDTLKVLYTCKKREPFFVEVPSMNYLTFKGSGHPSGDDFQKACEALYNISYIIKFHLARKLLEIDYKVNPMEVTWFLDKGKETTTYTWIMMIMQPDFITEEMFCSAMQIAKDRGKNIEYDRISFEKVEFGKCIQCFHLGDYNLMNDTLAKMKLYAEKNNVSCDPYTHDIYLNDMRKTKMENYKTIMRVKTYSNLL